MSLSDEQIMACLSHDGDRTAMLNAAYRMGMERAAEIAQRRMRHWSDSAQLEYVSVGASNRYAHLHSGAIALTELPGAIRAEAAATPRP